MQLERESTYEIIYKWCKKERNSQIDKRLKEV